MSKDNEKPDYEVGYGKPPKRTQFKKGQSGNPKGRPKAAKGFTANLKQELEDLVTVREGNREVKMPKAQAVAKRLVANFARRPKGGDRDQIRAIGAGEGDIAIANTYYLGRLVASKKPKDRKLTAKIGVFFPNQKGRGTHVNISGAGVTRYARNKAGAIKLLEFLVGPEAQKVFAEANFEYPVNPQAGQSAIVASWGTFKADSLNVAVLSKRNAEAVRLMDRAGWR